MKKLLENAAKFKRRKCLMCRKLFMSEWVGERVCKKCKASSSWRQGHTFSGQGWAQ
jgi:hypothetical protein